MMTFFLRAIFALGLAYVAAIAALWALQSRFIYPAPQGPAPLTPGYDEVRLQTADDLVLRAFYRAAEEGRHTVLYFHGNGGTLSGASISNAALAQAGIGVLMVEYRGYGGNPGSPSEEGFYRDGEAAVGWLTDRGIAPRNLVIIGNSIGAGVATEMARRHEPASLILIAPFASLPDAAQDALWWAPAALLVSDQYRNAAKIGEIDAPVLIQHGDSDNVIADHHGRRLAAIARDAAFQSFAGSGHALSFERRSQEARRDWILRLRQAPGALEPAP